MCEATMTSDPKNSGEAFDLMMDWAMGRRSWINLGPHEPYTPDVVAAMDAQEVLKWKAVYLAFVEGDEIAMRRR
jgi:hypothetical protein